MEDYIVPIPGEDPIKVSADSRYDALRRVVSIRPDLHGSYRMRDLTMIIKPLKANPKKAGRKPRWY